MGRRKIEIKPIRDDRNRSVTFLKRKGGLFKKAHELSVLCSVDVAVVIFGHNKKLYEYSSSDINDIIGRMQYYGGAHEHKGPSDFANKDGGGGGGDDDDDDGDIVDESQSHRGTPAPPEHALVPPHMQNHPRFQHVRHETPGASPPMHNGAMPQFSRGLSPLPPGVSRPSSRTSQHPGHSRRASSNLAPQNYPTQHPHPHQHPHQHPHNHPHQHPHPPPPPPPPPPQNYAYTPNPPFYNPQPHGSPAPRPPPGHPATYPPPYTQQQPVQQQVQQQQAQQQQQQSLQHVHMQDDRRASMPPSFSPNLPSQATGPRNPSQEQLAPSQAPPHRSPPPPHRPTPSPHPPQHEFTSPPPPQPKSLPAHARNNNNNNNNNNNHNNNNIFTPIDDSRSILAAHWGASAAADRPSSTPKAIKSEAGGPRSHATDGAAMRRGQDHGGRANGISPPPPPPPLPPPPPAPLPKSSDLERPQSRAAAPPTQARSNTAQSDAKRPRLTVQIPSEQSGDEAETGASGEEAVTTTRSMSGHAPPQQGHGVVLPPPSPSAGALLSAGAQGPPNPFARPAPPAHPMSRDIETPISALPSRFMADNLLPSPSTLYPEWSFARPNDSNMLPSPLNFQTPLVANGHGWREEDRKRQNEDEAGGDSKRTKA